MELIYLIGILAAGQGVFQTVLFITGIKSQEVDQFILGLILCFFSLSILEYILIWTGNISFFPHLLGFSSVFQFAFLPLVFLFFVAGKSKLRKNHLSHFIPFVLVLISFIPILLQRAEVKLHHIEKVFYYEYHILGFEIPLCILFCIQSLIYFTFVKSVKLRNTSLFGESLYTLFTLYIAVHLSHTFLITFLPDLLPYVGIGVLGISIFAIYRISFIAYNRGNVLLHEKKNKYAYSSLDKEAAQELLAKLESHLNEDKRYTDSSLNLSTISKALKISPKHISQAINQELGVSFRVYLNDYRIEHAQNLIKASEHSVSLKEVAFDSGFNNKTTFANAFKKKLDMTPSQYLKLQSQV